MRHLASAIILVVSMLVLALGCEQKQADTGPRGLEACADVKNAAQCKICCQDQGAIGHEFNARGSGEQPCVCEVRVTNQPE